MHVDKDIVVVTPPPPPSLKVRDWSVPHISIHARSVKCFCAIIHAMYYDINSIVASRVTCCSIDSNGTTPCCPNIETERIPSIIIEQHPVVLLVYATMKLRVFICMIQHQLVPTEYNEHK